MREQESTSHGLATHGVGSPVGIDYVYCSRKKIRLKRPPFKVSDLVPVALPALAILATCRQVYLETFDVFFSKNTLVITRPSCGTVCDTIPNLAAYDIFETFPMEGTGCLLTLGAHFAELPKIVLDIEALCDPRHVDPMRNENAEDTTACIKILYLIRVLWSPQRKGIFECRGPSTLSALRRPC